MSKQEPIKITAQMHCAECGERLVFVQEPGTNKVHVYACRACQGRQAATEQK